MEKLTHYRFTALVLMLCLAAALHAQTDLERLSMREVFSGCVADTRILSETRVEGEQLAKYHLTAFHSVQGSTTAKGFVQLERLLTADEKTVNEKEVQRTNQSIQFALFRYGQKDGTNHYLIYQRRGRTDFVCVYLEGTASVQQLKKTFCK